MQIYFWCGVFGLVVFSSSTRAADPLCGEPVKVEFASIQGKVSSEYPLGSIITYVCQHGYVVSGTKRTSECKLSDDEEKAEWTDPLVSCEPRSCGDPGYVPHGYLIGSLFTFPNSVNFACEEGYKLRGNSKRFCQASGSWSGRLPRCERISCNPPNNPDNGHVVFTSLEYGAELKYECNQGYHIQNKESVYCTSDGTWSNPDVLCVEITCEVPQSPEHGSVQLIGGDVDRPRAGTLAKFSCEEEYVPDNPTTSKCMDNGQWTFPSIQCLEPCTIIPVPNGRIGRYVSKRYSRVSTFSVIPVGTRLEDGERLFLHCDSGYSPLGTTTNWQERVVCVQGKWSVKPYCEPKACLSDPPETMNGRVEATDWRHEGTVQYRCLPDFKKIKSGNVTCYFGEWKGVPPICQDTKCFRKELVAVEQRGKKIFKHGEELNVTCEDRHTLANEEGITMKCEDGLWIGPDEPCVPASCYELPPSIEHGWADDISVRHSSFAEYFCDDGYVLIGNNEVQCSYGEWTGRPPMCKDSSCYLKNFSSLKGVSSETDSVTLSENRLNVHCTEGYSPQSVMPMCHNGAWSRNNESPCKEDDCAVHWISNGDIVKHSLGKNQWNYWKFRYERPSIFTKLSPGSIPSRRDSLFLICHPSYFVHGTREDKVVIQCSEGRWSPDPVCLKRGAHYAPTTRRPTLTIPRTRLTSSKPKITTPKSTSTLFDKSEEEELSASSKPTTQDEALIEDGKCFCEYALNDENIIAYTENKILETRDKIEDGSVVKFRCKDVGLGHMVGPKEMVCENCRSWDPSEFPVCINPKQGDTVIVYSDNVNVSVDGALEILRGSKTRLSCIAVEEAEYPKWSVPDETGIDAVPERMERTNDYLYISHLDIHEPIFENEGFYSCSIENYPPTTVELRVIDPDIRCPRLEFDEESLEVSTQDTNVCTEVTFFCRRTNQKLNGTNVSICLRNGTWSQPPPQCEDITCKEFKGTDLLQVSYLDNRRVGSFASFYCFSPGQLEGVTRTRCLKNGRWGNLAPSCRTPPCSAMSLFAVLPKKVEPEMDDLYNETLPYNTTVRLSCADNLALKGDSVAICGRDGQWKINQVQCVSGCPTLRKPEESKLMISPEKDVYNLGEIVTFSCTPGYYLNVENSKTMCFNGRWTENILPECVVSSAGEN